MQVNFDEMMKNFLLAVNGGNPGGQTPPRNY
jgi:hypothetical protein